MSTVRVGDIAIVQSEVKPVYTMVTANGRPAILLNINRQPDSNTVQVASEVHAEIDRIRNELAAKNIVIEDGPQGARWKVVKTDECAA